MVESCANLNPSTGSAIQAVRDISIDRHRVLRRFCGARGETPQTAIGRVMSPPAQYRPWSQYFCCMVVANRDFAEENPVATKRAMRALFKAADVCARDPERVARYLVAKGYEKRYEVALEVLNDLSYRRWRDMNPEDTVRFFSLRLHEAKIIKSSPQKIITHGTDWRFLNELKQELKA